MSHENVEKFLSLAWMHRRRRGEPVQYSSQWGSIDNTLIRTTYAGRNEWGRILQKSTECKYIIYFFHLWLMGGMWELMVSYTCSTIVISLIIGNSNRQKNHRKIKYARFRLFQLNFTLRKGSSKAQIVQKLPCICVHSVVKNLQEKSSALNFPLLFSEKVRREVDA